MRKLLLITCLMWLAFCSQSWAPTSIATTNEGYIYKVTAVYLAARDATSGSGVGSTSSLQIGQDVSNYIIYRIFLSFVLPDMESISAASLFLYGKTDASTTDFYIYAYTSTYADPITYEDYTRFSGWQTSGMYTGVNIIDAWDSATYSATWNELVFRTPYGLDSLFAKRNDTFKMAALSREDAIYSSAPTDAENIIFYSSTTAGKEPYLSITYSGGGPTGFAGKVSGVSTPAKVSGVALPLKISGVQ